MTPMTQSEDEVFRCSEELLSAIRSSREYSDYIAARKDLRRFPDKWERACRFRRDNFISRNYPGEDSAGGRAELFRQRQQLRMEPEIDRYLNAELVLCRMLRDCALKILNAADFDLENMNDIL